jgi:hypothetical protein
MNERSELGEGVWSRIKAFLEGERARIHEEIRAYPTPIPRCDEQFNHLIERRERLFQELVRLDTAARSNTVAGDGAARIEEFIDSSLYLDDDAKLRLKSALTEGVTNSELP